MVSLLHLANIKEEGVTFQSPIDGSEMLLTPEESIGIQNRLGEEMKWSQRDGFEMTCSRSQGALMREGNRLRGSLGPFCFA